MGDASTTGETALHRASRFARLACIRALLAAGACPLRATNRQVPLTLTLALAPTLTRTLALTLTNRQLDSALDVAGKSDKRINRAARLSVRKLLLEAAPHPNPNPNPSPNPKPNPSPRVTLTLSYPTILPKP